MTSLLVAIDYVTTADMADGQPLPPYIDDDGAVWRVVRRLPHARTRWCRIRLSEQATKTRAADRRLAACDLVTRRQSRHDKS